MIVLTYIFYIILLSYYALNAFHKIPFFNGYYLVVFLMWAANIFFIIYWNRKLWNSFKENVGTGEKTGYIVGSIFFPYIIIPIIISKISKSKKEQAQKNSV